MQNDFRGLSYGLPELLPKGFSLPSVTRKFLVTFLALHRALVLLERYVAFRDVGAMAFHRPFATFYYLPHVSLGGAIFFAAF